MQPAADCLPVTEERNSTMTLNLMIVNRWGTWQSADLRTTNPNTGKLEDDDSVKQVILHCTDGDAIVAYAGIGAVRKAGSSDWIGLSDWIRQILRGVSRTVDQSLIFLREQATKDIGPIAKQKYAHCFTIGATIGGRLWAVQIRNVENYEQLTSVPCTQASANFDTVAKEVGDDGVFVALGPPGAVLQSDLDTLRRVANVKPRKVEEFRALLGAVNRRAASTPKGKRFISPHCFTVYLPPAGKPVAGELRGEKGKVKPGIVLPSLAYGIDFTEGQKASLEIRNAASDEERQSILERAGNEAVTPRNLLRKAGP
jgi:hypothetical protein